MDYLCRLIYLENFYKICIECVHFFIQIWKQIKLSFDIDVNCSAFFIIIFTLRLCSLARNVLY